MDSNVTRARRKREQNKNKEAFVEVIGDPEMGIDGAYLTLQYRSSITPIENKYGEGSETVNPAKPSVSDFICDVYNVIKAAVDTELIIDFYSTYLMDIERLDKQQRKMLEQRVGRLLRQRGIYPVKRYFTVNVRN